MAMHFFGTAPQLRNTDNRTSLTLWIPLTTATTIINTTNFMS